MKPRWEILSELCNQNNYKIVAEIGVNRGINAANWIERCPQIEKAYLVDLLSNEVFSIHEFMDREISHKVEYLPIGSEKASKKVPDGLDLVFIDADHSYGAVKKDVELWMPKIRKGGIICGHDYIEIPESRYGIKCGVKDAIDEIFQDFNLEDDILEDGKLKIWWKYV